MRPSAIAYTCVPTSRLEVCWIEWLCSDFGLGEEPVTIDQIFARPFFFFRFSSRAGEVACL